MTHELKNIFNVYQAAKRANLKTVLATVVALEGSSYRKPGVRMLILENGTTEGAVSGGCVEKEICRQSQAVFASGKSMVITYDGRYRLGCEGVLYILLEPFAPSEEIQKVFWNSLNKRADLGIRSYFVQKEEVNPNFGSLIELEDQKYPLRKNIKPDSTLSCFTQTLKPSIQLFIIGSEHDAVRLTSTASQMGIDVIVVANPAEEKELINFPGAAEYLPILPEVFPLHRLDNNSAVVLMNHSYSKDLQYLLKLHTSRPFYIGILGPYRRREDLLNALLEHQPEVDDDFMDCIHGPAGIDIGAETPQEISVSILAEILMVHRGRTPVKLKDKKGAVHSPSL
ncbi:XdhC family protein [Muriicola soli]|uniref:XdhC/CoxI family protein n=1 Tax=Muriicola soli TaxID=2507538 RepID=A0A411E917_9FLAO|nr:XdhC/CoxI family protein [Muriicola soli]QBA64172.1 XdhC/CoxI family protein [Muriicola soli]